MCGIAGVLEFGVNEPVEGALRAMCRAMVHRGPDDEGIYTEPGVGLGMRRLSIIDLAAGHQPIANEDRTLWIVFNGEIYNHEALREELIARGHRFRTHCDTETILHLYEERGRECVQDLRGMFAFAIWDSRKRRMFLARDRLGIKPLYYRLTPELFLFGSEIKVVLAHPEVRPKFYRASLREYLAFGYLSGPETFYEGIHKLMPGYWLEIDDHGELQSEQYWNVPIVDHGSLRDENYYVNTYRDLLEDAVRSHLMSDVPLGVFLSGGLDSSAVAALMTHVRRDSIETFSVGYAEEAYSELPYARAVARHLNAIHHEVLVSEHEFFDTLPKLIWHEDEPIVWPSSIALYFVARLARQRVKVVLTGEGSDETLAGYSRYAFTLKNVAFDHIYRRLVPGSLRRQVRQSISDSGWISSGLRRKLAHTFLAKDGDSWAAFYLDNFFSAFSEKEQDGLLDDKVAREFEEGASYGHVLNYWENSSGEMLQRLLYTDIKTYLVELLMKQDNMSMAASIESRVPFLDHGLVEFAMQIPRVHLLKGLSGKAILKKAVEDLLPQSIVHRRKLGFPTPWSRWLAGPRLDRIEDLLLEERSTERGLFKPEAIRQLFQEHRARHRDHYDRIWRLLNLELWHRVCLEGDSHEAESRFSEK
jgi:asparagine synthase (glutamine-hydrolysing)